MAEWREENEHRYPGYQEHDRGKRLTKQGHLMSSLHNAKQHARKQAVPYSLTKESLPPIPETCPCCDVVFDKLGPRDKWPNLDRIVPRKGYVPENVHWICFRCNRQKQDATPGELMRMALFIRALTAPGIDAPDTCQACLPAGAGYALQPHDWSPDGQGGLIAYYTCPSGHKWSCWWNKNQVTDLP